MYNLPLLSRGLRPLVASSPTFALDRFAPRFTTLVAAQRGAVTHAQAVALGVTRKTIEWLLRSERWQVLHPGVYCVYTGPLSPGTLLWAGLLHAGSDAALDGYSGLGLHGLVGFEDHKVHVRVPNHRHPEKRPGLVIRRTRRLNPRSVVERQGFPVLRVERAALTVATTRPPQAAAVLSAVVQQGFTTADRLRGYAIDLGPVRNRAAVFPVLADIEGGSRFDLERIFDRIVVAHGLPRPVANRKVVLEGRTFYLDRSWDDPAPWFAEIDGRGYHILCEDWEDDLDRQNVLASHGWKPLRFSARALRDDPGGVARRISVALGVPPP